MTPVTARDAQARLSVTGASQATRGMLPGIILRGDSGRSGRSGTHFEAMIPGISLENSNNKGRRPGNPLCLTTAARGYILSMERGFRPKI